MLIAMWIAHFMLCRGGGPVAWVGIVVVIENVVSSAVHSHLFDFSQGWLYVFGIGVVGGMMLKRYPSADPATHDLALSARKSYEEPRH